MKNTRVALALLTAALTGCAAEPPVVYHEAGRIADPPPPVVREVEVPVAVPQLRRLASTRPTSIPAASAEQAITDAAHAATMGPTPEGFVQAVQTYPFVAGIVYDVVTSPGHVTTLMLRPGEQLLASIAGDTAQWLVADARSGSGDAVRTLVLIKPLRPNVQTNLVLSTSERVYTIDLRAVADAYHSAVQWTYPVEFAAQAEASYRAETRAQEATIAPGVNLADLDFGYRITAKGDKPDWMPRRAFTDGHKTYIAFPRDLASKEAPPLFVLGPRDEAQLVNYRLRDNYYVIDQVVRRAELRLGQNPQQIVVIERTAD